MLERIISHLLLRDRIPVYQERAAFYRRRAFIESLKNGFRIEEDKAVDLIDVTETSAMVLPNNSRVEFAIDCDGICFARIEEGKYYPINTKLAEEQLNKSRRYDQLSNSFWRRLKAEPYEMTIGTFRFELDGGFAPLSDELFLMGQELRDVNGLLRDSVKELENSITRLTEALDKLNSTDSSLPPHK